MKKWIGFLVVVLVIVLTTPQVRAVDGPLANATVSFGSWMTTPPFDRFPNVSRPDANHHALTPTEVTIKAGGTVNFIISGLHQVIVYDETNPDAINRESTVNTTGTPTVVLIDDPNNRIYRGLDPSLHPRDRVEVVQFDKPGLYLVICGVLEHFDDGMFGFVRVLPAKGKAPHPVH